MAHLHNGTKKTGPKSLQAEHEALSARVDELQRKPILTPSEQAELGRLKRLKLVSKDKLAGILRKLR